MTITPTELHDLQHTAEALLDAILRATQTHLTDTQRGRALAVLDAALVQYRLDLAQLRAELLETRFPL